MEFFDIRNPDGTVTGKIKERSLVHRDGDLHGTAHIFIIRQGEKEAEILLQKRSARKDAFPGCYDISSAGHLSAGQDYLEAALRELEEELGIRARAEDLLFIGYHRIYDREIFHGKPFLNHEISAVYLYRKEVDIRALTLQEEEVESVCWMPFSECMDKAVRHQEGYCLFESELKMIETYIDK
ncbi:MAG: NUDIX domain-containing protein [Eubacterium sp.]|nr:NUDIX domain-containing protein [Eubacterium sp.]